MIHKSILSFFFIIYTILLFGQAANCIDKKTNTWYFGNRAGLSFNTDPPTVLYDDSIVSLENCSSISDKTTGRILFYTNGIKVWDSTHHQMPNGYGLLGRFDAEQSAIVPFPSNPNKYYIFTTTHWNGTYYSIIDMTLNGGKGDIDTSKKNVQLIPAWVASDRITYTKHGNKRDYWVVTHLIFNDSFSPLLVFLTNKQPHRNVAVLKKK